MTTKQSTVAPARRGLPEGAERTAEKPASYYKQMNNTQLCVEFGHLLARFAQLQERIDHQAKELERLKKGGSSYRPEDYQSTLHKLESHTGETQPEPEDRMRMGYQDKIESARNAVKILPPNRIVNGRHSVADVTAICGFIVTSEMLDEVYKNFSHD